MGQTNTTTTSTRESSAANQVGTWSALVAVLYGPLTEWWILLLLNETITSAFFDVVFHIRIQLEMMSLGCHGEWFDYANPKCWTLRGVPDYYYYTNTYKLCERIESKLRQTESAGSVLYEYFCGKPLLIGFSMLIMNPEEKQMNTYYVLWNDITSKTKLIDNIPILTE